MKSLPFVLKDNYLSVVVGGRPFALDCSHPTFDELAEALKNKKWNRVPKLISVAEKVNKESGGLIQVKNGNVTFKGRIVHNNLSNRIVQLVKAKKPVQHMVKFMANLYQNPSSEAVQEFYNWLEKNGLPITDDGCFLAYKSVNSKNRDTHTGTINNSPGQVIMMPRKAGDPNWRTQCSSGFHVCSKEYGVYGDKTMAVKVNPRDVLSAQDGKMRVIRYEVLAELGSKREDLFKIEGFSVLEGKTVIEVKKERAAFLKKILGLAVIKRAIKSRKLTKKKLLKMPYARLKKVVEQYVPSQPPKFGPEDANALMKARKAAGLSVGQVAKNMKVPYKKVVEIENKNGPSQTLIDSYLYAIADLCKIRDISSSAISYPKTVKRA